MEGKKPNQGVDHCQMSTLFLSGGISMMCKRPTKLLGVFLVLGLLVGHVNADLVGNWKFDESVRGYILCVEFVQ